MYLRAAQRFLEAADLYRLEDGSMPFKYAPATAALFTPFTLLPARVAVALWNLGSVLGLVAVAHLTTRLRGPGASLPPRWGKVVAILALLPAFSMEIFYGQVDLAILLLVVLAAVGAERGRVWGPAVAFAVAVLLKPPAAVAGLFFLLRWHVRVLGATGAVALVLWSLGIARYGWAGSLHQTTLWVETLARTTAPWALGSSAQGLPTVFLSWFFPPEAIPSPGAMLAAQVSSILVFVAGVLWARPDPARLLAVCCAAVALLSPQAWRANFMCAWPLVLLAVETRSRTALALVGLIAALGMVISDSVLGEAASRPVLFLRPFGYAYALLMGWFLWRARASRVGRSAGDAGVGAGSARS